MALRTNAQLTSENVSIISSQVNPDTITPTTLATILQDIIDSMVNQLDQTIGGTSINTLIQNAVNQALGGSVSMDINAFRALKTLDQPIAGTSGNYRIYFEDDTTAANGAYDNGNHFYTDEYVAGGSMTKTFAVEQQKYKSAATATFRLVIFKNGVEIGTSATYNSGSSLDAYGNASSATNGFEIPPLAIPGVTLIAGDKITAEIVVVYSGGTAASTIKLGGIFSNG